MSRKFLIPLVAATFFAAPAFAPASMIERVSGSALAGLARVEPSGRDTRLKRTGKIKQPDNVRTKKSIIPTGNGTPGGTVRATTVKSSKSNTSDRMGGGGGKSAGKVKIDLESPSDRRATTVKSSKSNTSD